MKELLYFTASWCQPCSDVEIAVDKFISDNPEIKYTKIDIGENPSIIEDYEIKSLPTLIAIKESEELLRHLGIATEADINMLFADSL